MIRAKHHIVTQYWSTYFINHKHGSCGLCGSTGLVDTRDSVKAADGSPAGIKTFCICPTGQNRRNNSEAGIIKKIQD